MVLLDLRIDKLTAMRFEALVRPLLIRSHQPRVTRDVGSEYRSKVARGTWSRIAGKPSALTDGTVERRRVGHRGPFQPTTLGASLLCAMVE